MILTLGLKVVLKGVECMLYVVAVRSPIYEIEIVDSICINHSALKGVEGIHIDAFMTVESCLFLVREIRI